jgi:adenine-specific DNA methylase
MQKRFIEYDLPLADISEESAREKNIRHGHPSTLHIWWARRPLAASRATTFAALLDDPGPHEPEKRREIKDLIKEIAPWEAVKHGNSDAIKKAQDLIKEQYGEDTPPKVLDPFAGGGSIPLEALRLGCETYASDYNPVAVFIEKATLEWPQKFGVEVELPEGYDEDVENGELGVGSKKVNLLAYLVEKWASKILKEAREEIGPFYPTETGEGLVGKRDVDPDQEGWTPVGYLWARTLPCQNPTCSCTIPLVKQFWLAKKKKSDPKKSKLVAYRPVVDREAETVDFELLHGDALQDAMDDGFDPKDGTVHRANASCPVCGQVTKAKQVRQLAKDGHMGERMVAVVLHHPDETGKKYRLATEADRQTFDEAAAYLDEKLAAWPHLESPLPEEEIPLMSGTFNVPLYGLDQWKKLFNPRQQLALVTFADKIKSSHERMVDDCRALTDATDADLRAEALAKAVVGYLGVNLGRLSDYSSNLMQWVSSGEFAAHTFVRQALPISWDYFENSSLSGAGGEWTSHRDWVLRYIHKNDWTPSSPSTATSDSATSLPQESNTLDAVVTDPPYYNSVPYADLSDFFYVWMKRAVGERFPELFSTPLTPKSQEATEMVGWDAERYGHKDKHFFEEQLGASFQEMHRVLKPSGTAVIVYAHKTTEGWETMLSALVNAGFVVTGSWPMHTERKARLRAAQSAALASSIYMVCRKAEREPLGFWNDLQPQIKARVEEKLEQFWEAGLIRGGDFFISAIGPGMEAYSRYEAVETYDGRTVSVADLLQYIRQVATDFLVHRLLKGAGSGAIDKEAQFYLTYRWTFQDTRVEYDDARRIAAAEGVNIDRLAEAGSFIKKTRKYVYVHGPEERPGAVDTIGNMVDAMHLACRMWEQGHREEIGQQLAEAGYNQSGAFWQLCQAVAECLPEKNKEKQLLEGLLMSKDKYQEAEATGSDGAGGDGQFQLEFDTREDT